MGISDESSLLGLNTNSSCCNRRRCGCILTVVIIACVAGAFIPMAVIFSIPPTGCVDTDALFPEQFVAFTQYAKFQQQFYFRDTTSQQIFASVWTPWVNLRHTMYLIDSNEQLSGEAFVKIFSIFPVLRISLARNNNDSTCSMEMYGSIREASWGSGYRMQIELVNPGATDWDDSQVVATSTLVSFFSTELTVQTNGGVQLAAMRRASYFLESWNFLVNTEESDKVMDRRIFPYIMYFYKYITTSKD